MKDPRLNSDVSHINQEFVNPGFSSDETCFHQGKTALEAASSCLGASAATVKEPGEPGTVRDKCDNLRKSEMGDQWAGCR